MTRASTRPLSPAQTGAIVIDVLTGDDSVEHAASVLRLPQGQLFGWCDRVKAAFIREDDDGPRWLAETGTVDVLHTAECASTVAIGDPVTFTVTITNRTLATLYGVRIIQRGFSNAVLGELHYEVPWQRVAGSHHALEPGGLQRYVATYRLTIEDIAPPGDLINAVAVTGFTATGQRFYAEQDATLEFTDAAWDLGPMTDRNLRARRAH